MSPLIYSAHLAPQGSEGFLVRFPNVPEAITQGADLSEATMQAEDALAVALDGYLFAGRDFPEPETADAADGVIVVDVPVRPITAARWLLKREMRRRSMSQVALGVLMGRDEKTVRRIVTGRGASLELALKALAVLGIRPALAVQAASDW